MLVHIKYLVYTQTTAGVAGGGRGGGCDLHACFLPLQPSAEPAFGREPAAGMAQGCWQCCHRPSSPHVSDQSLPLSSSSSRWRVAEAECSTVLDLGQRGVRGLSTAPRCPISQDRCRDGQEGTGVPEGWEICLPPPPQNLSFSPAAFGNASCHHTRACTRAVRRPCPALSQTLPDTTRRDGLG